MSNVIRFLEAMGQDAALGRLQDAGYAAAVAALGLDDAAREALLRRDAGGLNALLGGRSNVLSLLVPADDDKKDEDDEEKQDEDRPTQVRAA